MKIDDRKTNRSIDDNRLIIVNWHRLASANRWSIDNHTEVVANFIDCHRLALNSCLRIFRYRASARRSYIIFKPQLQSLRILQQVLFPRQPPWQVLLVNQAQDPVETFLGILQVTWAQVPEASLQMRNWQSSLLQRSRFQRLTVIHCFPESVQSQDRLTVLYYYDEEKERIIHLLLHILFIFDLISISMDNITYYFVITALTSINAFLLINYVGFLYSSLLGLIMLLLICYMFTRANVISVCKDVNFRHAVNDPLPWQCGEA